MKTLRLTTVFAFTLVLVCCKGSEPKTDEVIAVTDNPELITLYTADQADRQTENINWPVVLKNDSSRQARVNQLLHAGQVRTALDYANAAMIFQHGQDTVASGMAVKMMKKAIALDPTADKWLLAAAIDRDLMRRGKPQIYGTQYVKINDEPAKLYDIDTTQISDEERKAYGVETLAEQREKVKSMNKKSLSELAASGKSIDEIVAMAKQPTSEAEKYRFSEDGINSFGYELMEARKYEDAEKVFKLNTALYPKQANTYDSYGESLLKLGKKEAAIVAYKKSLELDPKNKNAEKVLSEIQ